MHDDYARRTPYELAFPDREVARERFRSIREEAAERGEDSALLEPGRFLALPRAAEVLHEIRDPRAGAEKAHQHGVLLFHAFHFEAAGRPLYLLETHAARYLVESPPSPRDDGEASPLPEPSAYLQLPRHLFWTRPAEEGPPEPVDGIFWSAPGGERLAVLLATGIREDRPGLSVVPLPPVPLSDAPAWLEARIRPEGRDFASNLPGGELERLYSFEATGEVLKLLARLFRYLELFPDAVTPHRTPASGEGEGAGGEDRAAPGRGGGDPRSPDDDSGHDPPPTTLPYRRIALGDERGLDVNRDTGP